MKMRNIWIMVIVLWSCHTAEPVGTIVTVHIKSANNKKIFLEQVAFKDETTVLLDSAIAKGAEDVIVFTLKNKEERLFEIKDDDIGLDIPFINDSSHIDIYVNYPSPKRYRFEHSWASVRLQTFLEEQAAIAEEGRKISIQIDSLSKIKAPALQLELLKKYLDRNTASVFQRTREFEDTVRSPGLFLALYNNVDFGKDYKGLKDFTARAAARFPKHSIVQKLKEETFEYVKIFEEEYEVGDTLPSIVLNDDHNLFFSTASLKGKYYLIDFWSTWCEPCMPYNKAKKKAKQFFPADQFEIVSVAIDAEKDTWKQMIAKNGYDWHQLIDEKIWDGPTVKTLKFDSIPFNFLVSPEGKVIAKAIKPDSIIPVISKYLHPVKK